LKYTTCQGALSTNIHLLPVECKDILCNCIVCVVPTTKYGNMQQLLVLFVGSFAHKKCLLLVDCVNCIYASAWVKCNEFEVILGRFLFYELLVSVFLCSRIQRLDTSNTKNHHKISLNVYFYFTIPIHFFLFHIMPSSLSLKSCQVM
jgi:hypothetical protein